MVPQSRSQAAWWSVHHAASSGAGPGPAESCGCLVWLLPGNGGPNRGGPRAGLLGRSEGSCSAGGSRRKQSECAPAPEWTAGAGRGAAADPAAAEVAAAGSRGVSSRLEPPQGQLLLRAPQKTRWIEAHHACATLDRRARLASVHPESAAFVKNFSKALDVIQYPRIWIGLTRLGDENSWVWSDGTPVDYVNWDLTQPNNHGGNQDCVHLGGTPRLEEKLWHDNVCSGMYHVMCQLHLR